MTTLILRIRLFFATQSYRFHLRESAYHDRSKCQHRNAASEHRFRARHFEAEVSRLRMKLAQLPVVTKGVQA